MAIKFLKLQVDSNRIYGLDVLRAIAILSVVFSHSEFILPLKIKFATYYALDGVTIFFVLSGFLIGRILIQTFQKDISF